jgi:hypothetical protein
LEDLVSYTNNFWDVAVFFFYHLTRNRMLVGLLGVLFVASAAVLWVMILPEAALPDRVFTLVVVEVGTWTTAIVIAGLFGVVFLFLTTDRTFLTTHTITLDEEGFTEETALNRSERKWSGAQVRRTGRYIFLYVSRNAAHVIPRRAFADYVEWECFYECCRSRCAGRT